MTPTDSRALAGALMRNLRDNILPYWERNMSDPRGGFYGRRDGNDTLHPDAEKGAILHARILWTFSAAYCATGARDYLTTAHNAYDYIATRFIDTVYGGIFWSLAPDGSPIDPKKQFYAIAFTIYGLAEYYRATANPDALSLALELFDTIETHSRDRDKLGYIEATTRDWHPIADMRLSEKDLNASKTMNTHLHILEAYTNLARQTDNPHVKDALRDLLEIFLDKIVQPDGHLGLFFDDDWNLADNTYSYGHDIEASWLMFEAAEVLGDPGLLDKTRIVTRHIALAALEGFMSDGSMIYERHADGNLDEERHWWVQAECLVGLTYLAAFHDMPQMLEAARKCWEYIRTNLVDTENGEWHWSRLPDGTINRREDKAGFWKCPYHNSRACIEAARILTDPLPS